MTLPPRHLGLPPGLAAAVRAAARGEDTYVVGGYVRDRLLDRAVRDADLAVAGDPRALANRLGRAAGGSVFPLSAEHGAWRVTLRTPVDGIEHLDVTSLRGDLVADLAARDFTVNAIAVRPDGEDVADPFDGRADLGRRALRLVSPGAIRADPIRALRAVRFVAELEFAIDAASAEQIGRDAPAIVRTADERQRDEIVRALDTPRGANSVRLMDRLGLLARLLPELEPARGCEQPKEHYWDVLDHSVETVAVLDCLLAAEPAGAGCAERVAVLRSLWPEEALRRWDERVGEGRTRRAVLKLIGLLHDVSKPQTRALQPDGRVRFFEHDRLGARVAGEVFRRLRFSARETALAETLVRYHLRPGQLAAPGQEPTRRALYRFFKDLGDAVPDLLALNLADGAAAAGPRQTSEDWLRHCAYTGWILRQPQDHEELVRPKRLLDGNDLIAELGLAPGPALGRLLDALAEAEAAGDITTREQALGLARDLAATDT